MTTMMTIIRRIVLARKKNKKEIVKRVRKNHAEKKRWKMLSQLRDKVEGRKEVNAPHIETMHQ